MITQYFIWIKGIILEGDFGQSLEFNAPVSSLIWERMGLTVLISSSTLIFIWLFAIPIGVYSATHQYSLFDYGLTFVGFVGRAFPNFMLALVLLWIGFAYLEVDVSGLFSPEFRGEPWSLPKVMDMLGHMWVPIIVLGTGGAAGLIRTMRANTLDELPKPYVETARAKGVDAPGLIERRSAGFYLNQADEVTVRNCKVVWGRHRPDYFGHAAEAHDVTGLTIYNLKGAAAHPERDEPIRIVPEADVELGEGYPEFNWK